MTLLPGHVSLPGSHLPVDLSLLSARGLSISHKPLVDTMAALHLALFGGALALVREALAFVGSAFPLVRQALALVRDPLALVRHPLSAVGGRLAFGQEFSLPLERVGTLAPRGELLALDSKLLALPGNALAVRGDALAVASHLVQRPIRLPRLVERRLDAPSWIAVLGHPDQTPLGRGQAYLGWSRAGRG